MKTILKIPRFSKSGAIYRNEFLARYDDERGSHSSRFIWDAWHVPDQYSLLRTPAEFLFSEKTYAKLLSDLLAFGKDRLGCHGLSKPWVSLYLDGAFQNLHTDSPHGPWAYVYSLTDWKRRSFEGGETLLARDTLLEYWTPPRMKNGTRTGYELPDFFQEVAPEFNQLLVFDPRIPHGVKRVSGIRDPREGRLVVHGWFAESRPFMEGSLSQFKKLEEWLESESRKLAPLFSEFTEASGTITLRIQFSSDGSIESWKVLTNTLRRVKDVVKFNRRLGGFINDLKAPRAKSSSVLTLPLLF